MTLLWKKLPINQPLLPNPPLLSRMSSSQSLRSLHCTALLEQVPSLRRLLVMPFLRKTKAATETVFENICSFFPGATFL